MVIFFLFQGLILHKLIPEGGKDADNFQHILRRSRRIRGLPPPDQHEAELYLRGVEAKRLERVRYRALQRKLPIHCKKCIYNGLFVISRNFLQSPDV